MAEAGEVTSCDFQTIYNSYINTEQVVLRLKTRNETIKLLLIEKREMKRSIMWNKLIYKMLYLFMLYL